MKKILNRFASVKKYAVAHKFISVIAVVIVLGGGWYVYAKATSTSGQVRYAVGTVAQNTIISSVSESGQVTASRTLNITPQVSGQILHIYVTPGEQVKAGATIAMLDPTTAEEAVTSAKENLQSAQIALAKLQEPATTLTLTEQQDALTQAQSNLTTLYQSSFSDVTNTFLDLPTIISGLQDVDLGSEAGGASQWNIDYYSSQVSKYNSSAQSYRDAAYNDYETARTSYDQTFSDFKSLSSTPDQATITKILSETYATTGLVATAAKSANDLIQFYSDQLTQNGATPKSTAATQITNLNSYLSKAQSHLSTLLSDVNNLQGDQQSITEKEQTLAQTKAGADTLDIQSDQLNVTKAEDALSQAEQTLSEYYVTAPFAGTIASVPLNEYDQAGSGTTLATLITSQQYADLSINEVDAAKIQLGDKATITFDAIPSLTLTGTVAQLSPSGTVSQGVVTYDVKVAFDTQNPQVKSGMSVNVNIETAVHQDVLTIPSSAIKTAGGASYVQVFTPPLATSTVAAAGTAGVVSATAPQNVPVTVGISDNTNTEITSGLTLGEQIVTRTISGSTAATTATTGTGGAGATGAARTTGGGFGGGGGAIRIGG
ncbi:MAG: efflux RND transporter periplasmic adaptor subunit [Patescibacteria group bacterium]|nr:efflux RND transporter periplasmic adaptor subunit [Patescibacteria group bacterium]